MLGGSRQWTHDTARGLDEPPVPGGPGNGVGRENSPGVAENPARRILVVDDEALLRWSIVEMLSTAGYAVVDAGTGRDASRLFDDTAHPIDGLVLDLKLPDTDGIDLLRAARRQGLTCPAILMTAYGTSEAVEQALAAGARLVVAKPFDLADLLQLVQQIVPRSPR
jgi:CheY-like chemotaxis protein